MDSVGDWHVMWVMDDVGDRYVVSVMDNVGGRYVVSCSVDDRTMHCGGHKLGPGKQRNLQPHTNLWQVVMIAAFLPPLLFIARKLLKYLYSDSLVNMGILYLPNLVFQHGRC